jgi:hypothetical protein
MANFKNKAVSTSQQKLINYFYKKDPKLTEKDITALLSDTKRFVNLVKKMRTEPQARVVYKDRKVDGKIIKDKIFNTDLEELQKVLEPNEILSMKSFRKLHESLAKKKNG